MVGIAAANPCDQLASSRRSADSGGADDTSDGKILDIKIADLKATAPHFHTHSTDLAKALTKLKTGLEAAGSPRGERSRQGQEDRPGHDRDVVAGCRRGRSPRCGQNLAAFADDLEAVTAAANKSARSIIEHNKGEAISAFDDPFRRRYYYDGHGWLQDMIDGARDTAKAL